MSINRLKADSVFVEGGLLTGEMLAAGAIVESGENSNGQYWRWENGLQVCYLGQLTVNSPPTESRGAIFINAGTRWDYPSNFSSQVATIAGGSGSFTRWVSHNGGGSGNSTNFYVFSATTDETITNVYGCFVIGRWK